MSEVLPSLLVLVVAALGAGCYTSDVALSPVPEGSMDAKALGTWRCVQSDPESPDAMTLKVSPAEAGHYLAEFSVPREPASLFRFHPSRIGGTTIMNVQEVKSGDAKGEWIFVRYWLLRGDVLDISVVTESALKGKGTSASALREAIAARVEDEGIYQNYCVCARVSKVP